MSSVPHSDKHLDGPSLSAYHDGELRGFAKAEVEQHLATCPRCRRALSDIAALSQALRDLPDVEPPRNVRQAVLESVSAPRRRSRRLTWGIAAAIAAIAALIGGYDYVTAPQGTAVPMRAAFMPHTPSPASPRLSSLSSASPNTAAGGQAGTAQSANGPRLPAAAKGNAPVPDTSAGTATTQAPPAPNATQARLIARTGQVDLRVRDVQGTFKKVSAIVGQQRGYVSDSNNNVTANSGQSGATLTLRVPAANFQATLDAIAALPHTGLTVRSSSQDITDSYHDLQAQAQALRATRDQLMALLHQTHKVGDAMSVLDRLTEVNAQLDGVQSQIMSSSNSVMLSSVAVTLTPEPKKAVVHHAKKTSAWQPGHAFAGAVGNVVAAIQAMLTAAIYALVYLALPALLIGMAALLWRGFGPGRRASAR
jgi:anti-sigma factor RsiW